MHHTVLETFLLVCLLIVSSLTTIAGAALVTNGPPVPTVADIDAGFVWASTILFTGAFGFIAAVISFK